MTAIPMPITPARRAPKWFGGPMPFARFALIVNLLVPLAILIWDALHAYLGADPVNFAIHTTGFVALLYLTLSLAVTPLRAISGFSWLVQFRRSLGVYAFYYAAAHLAIYFWWDRGHNFGSTVHEITHRLYLAIGFTALSLMLPLWATSFDRAIRALGKWWKRLHRLAYVAAILGCIHYYIEVKADVRKPLIFIGAITLLLGFRLVAAIVKRVKSPRRRLAANAVSVPADATKSRHWKGEMRVAGIFRETPTVSTFRLVPAGGGPIPFTYSAGQFLSLQLTIDGKRVSRSYTIASPPTRDAYIELTIKREDRGHVSRYLHEMLMTGKSVTVSAPAGRFTLRDDSANAVLLIAGGVGITPVMSILRDLTDRCWPGKIDLVFSVRAADDVIFKQELELLAARHSNLKIHLTITRDAPPDWRGSRERISAALLKQLVPDFAARPAFVCGPDAMAQAVNQELLKAGCDASRVTLESFTPAAAVAKDDGASPANEMAGEAVDGVLTFAKSDQSAPLPAQKTVLEIAESLGVQIDYDCRSGICGTCRVKLLGGEVYMPVKDALSDADLEDGFILACQAHAANDADPVTVDA